MKQNENKLKEISELNASDDINNSVVDTEIVEIQEKDVTSTIQGAPVRGIDDFSEAELRLILSLTSSEKTKDKITPKELQLLQEYDEAVAFAEAEKQEETPEAIKLDKKWKRVSILMLFVGVIVCSVALGVEITNSKRLQAKRDACPIELSAYEFNKNTVALRVIDLLSVHNNDSYLKAKNSVPLSKHLKERLFKKDVYTGLYRSSEPPKITTLGVLYAMEDTDTQDYLLSITRENTYTKEVEHLFVKVVVDNALIIDYSIY